MPVYAVKDQLNTHLPRDSAQQNLLKTDEFTLDSKSIVVLNLFVVNNITVSQTRSHPWRCL